MNRLIYLFFDFNIKVVCILDNDYDGGGRSDLPGLYFGGC